MGFPIVHELICPTVGIEWICYPKFGIIRLMDKNSTQENPIIRGACHILVHKEVSELKALIMKNDKDDLQTSEFKAVKEHLFGIQLIVKFRRLKKDGRVKVTEYHPDGEIENYYEDERE